MGGHVYLTRALRALGFDQVPAWSGAKVGQFVAKQVNVKWNGEPDSSLPGYSVSLPVTVHDVCVPEREAVVEFVFNANGQYLEHNVVCL